MNTYLTPEGYDLTIPQDVLLYLAKTPFASIQVIPLSGGTANYVFRLQLKIPYEGRDSLVLKHARPYIKDWVTFAYAVERQVREFFFSFGSVNEILNSMVDIYYRTMK